ncbi:MAG: hypothetical protein Q7K26_06360 [bacterium]|nr:hypothetical protein [bacterium]
MKNKRPSTFDIALDFPYVIPLLMGFALTSLFFGPSVQIATLFFVLMIGTSRNLQNLALEIVRPIAHICFDVVKAFPKTICILAGVVLISVLFGIKIAAIFLALLAISIAASL